MNTKKKKKKYPISPLASLKRRVVPAELTLRQTLHLGQIIA